MSFTESGAKRKREGEWEGGSWTLKLGLIDWSFEREKKSQKIERIFKISALVRFGHASFCGSAADSAALPQSGVAAENKQTTSFWPQLDRVACLSAVGRTFSSGGLGMLTWILVRFDWF